MVCVDCGKETKVGPHGKPYKWCFTCREKNSEENRHYNEGDQQLKPNYFQSAAAIQKKDNVRRLALLNTAVELAKLNLRQKMSEEELIASATKLEKWVTE